MCENNRNCPDCGGSDALHYSDCIYDGTDGPGSHSSGSKRGSGGSSGIILIFYIIALIIGYGINELVGKQYNLFG